MIYYLHDKLKRCMTDMISGEIYPFYGEFNLFVNFIKDATVETCGVNVTESGMNFYWCEEFLNKLSQQEVNFIFIHETFHLLFDHPTRSEGYDLNISNLAQDMIINQIIYDDVVKNNKPILKDFVKVPKDNSGKVLAQFPPKDYDGNLIFEELYWWLKKKFEDYQSEKLRGFVDLKKLFDSIEQSKGCTLDKHLDDDVNKEYRKQLVNGVKESLKSRGLLSSDIEKSMSKLIKHNTDYLRELKRNIINHIFGDSKNKTIVRPNRKNIDGIKGFKKHRKIINGILDTSGSMSKEIENVLSFIFQNNIMINLIQIDAKVKDFRVIKHMGQLKDLKIKGGGGTVLTPGIQMINNHNKLKSNNTIILTDGHCDVLDFTGSKNKTLILTTSKTPIIKNGKKVKIIKIEPTK